MPEGLDESYTCAKSYTVGLYVSLGESAFFLESTRATKSTRAWKIAGKSAETGQRDRYMNTDILRLCTTAIVMYVKTKQRNARRPDRITRPIIMQSDSQSAKNCSIASCTGLSRSRGAVDLNPRRQRETSPLLNLLVVSQQALFSAWSLPFQSALPGLPTASFLYPSGGTAVS